jgi:hypothetical protein
MRRATHRQVLATSKKEDPYGYRAKDKMEPRITIRGIDDEHWSHKTALLSKDSTLLFPRQIQSTLQGLKMTPAAMIDKNLTDVVAVTKTFITDDDFKPYTVYTVRIDVEATRNLRACGMDEAAIHSYVLLQVSDAMK